MKKAFKKFAIASGIFIFCIFIFIIIILNFFACGISLLDNTYTDKENNYIIYSVIGGDTCIFSDKVKLMNDSFLQDELSILCNSKDKGVNSKSWYTILKGDFDKWACFNGSLAILWNDEYYVFNINDYKVPETDIEVAVTDYELNKYSKNEFFNLYPDYEKYKWREYVKKE